MTEMTSYSRTDLIVVAEYLGCYVDNSTRELKYNTSLTITTINQCRLLCQTNTSKYSGVQYGTECWCGNVFNTYAKAPEIECNLTCGVVPAKRSTTTCGGSYRNNVWRSDSGSATAVDLMMAGGSNVDAWEGDCLSVSTLFFFNSQDI